MKNESNTTTTTSLTDEEIKEGLANKSLEFKENNFEIYS